MPTIIPIPRVIDISHYNVIETLSHAVELGIWGVIHKATEGTGVLDKKIEARRFISHQAGLLFGTYHFIRPGNVKQQVEWYLKNAKPTDRDLTCLDWEDNRVGLDSASEFLSGVKFRTGRKPVLYSGNTAKEKIKTTDIFLGSHRLWLAQYGNKPSVQKSWENFWLWQFTGDGLGPLPHNIEGMTIPGNKGMDINHYAGTKDQLMKEWPGA